MHRGTGLRVVTGVTLQPRRTSRRAQSRLRLDRASRPKTEWLQAGGSGTTARRDSGLSFAHESPPRRRARFGRLVF